MVSTEAELLSLSWDDMVKAIPVPKATITGKKQAVPVTRKLSSASTRKKPLLRSSGPVDDKVSFAVQKMTVFCTEEELVGEGRTLAHAMLFSLPPAEILENLQKIYRTYIEAKPSTPATRKNSFPKFMKMKSAVSMERNKATALDVQVFQLDFGLPPGTLAPLHENMAAELTLPLITGKGKFFWTLPNPDPAYTITVNPSVGSFKKKGDQHFEITVVFHSSITLEEIISLEIPGGLVHLCTILGHRPWDLTEREKEPGATSSWYHWKANSLSLINFPSVVIPPALESMKEYFLKSEKLKTPRIFFNEGDEEEILTIRDKLNREVFQECRDENALATVFLAWFGEQSPLLLQQLSDSAILGAGGQSEYKSLVDKLPQPNQKIFQWLNDFMVDILAHSDANKIELAELADLFGPLLYASEDEDPEKKEKVTSAVSQMLQSLIEHQKKLR